MLIGAIKNEIEKLYFKKRIHVVIGIVLFFTLLMVTLSYFDKDNEDPIDWQITIEEQITGIESRLTTINNQSSDEYMNLVNQKEKLNFQLKNDINPEVSGATGDLASSVTGVFIKLILPVLIVILTADLIVGETSNGTMKSLLVSPLGRKKIILSKFLASLIISIGVMLLSNVLTYITSIPFYGLGSWNDLIVIGNENFKAIPIWEYILYGLGLNMVTIITLISVVILISVLFETVTTSVSLSLSLIVFGGLLGNLQSTLEVLKYFFILNLDLVSNIIGESTVHNTTFLVSLLTMLITMLLCFLLSFSIFSKKDMLI
ncbi:ABC transporter permease [Paraliobacillus sp. JSM ZJ581]|uniref:ABC transporter permease n=1 Tax=Paraliobacillus sp. JSM ZJ581 TaxID=3342118 RepID=UPI0035A84C84